MNTNSKAQWADGFMQSAHQRGSYSFLKVWAVAPSTDAGRSWFARISSHFDQPSRHRSMVAASHHRLGVAAQSHAMPLPGMGSRAACKVPRIGAAACTRPTIASGFSRLHAPGWAGPRTGPSARPLVSGSAKLPGSSEGGNLSGSGIINNGENLVFTSKDGETVSLTMSMEDASVSPLKVALEFAQAKMREATSVREAAEAQAQEVAQVRGCEQCEFVASLNVSCTKLGKLPESKLRQVLHGWMPIMDPVW